MCVGKTVVHRYCNSEEVARVRARAAPNDGCDAVGEVTTCHCSTDLCNGPAKPNPGTLSGGAMRLPFGHVIMVVTLFINVITGYQL